MPTNTISFEISFKDASIGLDARLFNVSEFKADFLWGIPLSDRTGKTISDQVLDAKIKTAQDLIQQSLEIRLFKQYISEQKDFDISEYANWGYIKANYNVSKIIGVAGRLNELKIIQYPTEWLTIFRQQPQYSQMRNVYLVPNGSGTAISLNQLAVMNNPWFSIYGTGRIPNYWFLEYITGFDEVPSTLLNAIGKYAAIQVMPILEQSINGGGRGNNFGIANNSLSMDGLSQNASKVNGGNIFQARVKQYTDELRTEMAMLRDVFTGISFDVV